MEELGKGSIGNYKGVMLCNRPPETGIATRAVDNGGSQAFNPNVKAHDPVGWNPSKKPMPRRTKKKRKYNRLMVT